MAQILKDVVALLHNKLVKDANIMVNTRTSYIVKTLENTGLQRFIKIFFRVYIKLASAKIYCSLLIFFNGKLLFLINLPQIR